MDYEKALEKARAAYGTGAYDDATLEFIFPQLKESEEERVIKGLENFLWCIANGGMNDRGTMPSAEMCQKWLAYLEKQKEKYRVYDEKSYHQVKRESWNSYEPMKEKFSTEELFYKGFYEGYQFGIHEEKPHIWTKHDEAVRKEAIACLQQWGNNFPINGVDYSTILYWLKEELSVHTKNEQKTTNELTVEILTRAGLKPYKDGNKWCILAGENIQEGICGFGDTIEEALYEFLKDVIDMQKEQKPAEWSGVDDLRLHQTINVCDRNGYPVLSMWLKRLPRRVTPQSSCNPAWRIWRNGACGNSEGNPIALVKTYGGYKLVSCLGADGEKYIMLSDLEKLPGYNEK